MARLLSVSVASLAKLWRQCRLLCRVLSWVEVCNTAADRAGRSCDRTDVSTPHCLRVCRVAAGHTTHAIDRVTDATCMRGDPSGTHTRISITRRSDPFIAQSLPLLRHVSPQRSSCTPPSLGHSATALRHQSTSTHSSAPSSCGVVSCRVELAARLSAPLAGRHSPLSTSIRRRCQLLFIGTDTTHAMRAHGRTDSRTVARLSSQPAQCFEWSVLGCGGSAAWSDGCSML